METAEIIFIHQGTSFKVQAEVGASLLQVAQENGLDVEGACEGNMACATCHMVLAETLYDTLSSPSIEEEEMLDLAIGLTATSRLGCQILVTSDMDGETIVIAEEAGSVLGL